MIVVDASVVLEVLLNTTVGAELADTWFAPAESLHAPHLVDLEVAQVLRRWVRSGQIDADRGGRAIEDLVDLPLTRYPHDVLVERIWGLRGQVTAYDGAYLALAEILDAPLVTRDKRLTAAKGHTAKIEIV